MSDIEAPKTRKDFLDIIQKIAPAKHRYSVFSDFVIMAATCLHNRIVMDQDRENEYLTIIRSYTKKEEQSAFSTLLHILIELLDEEPVDQLGGIFMELGFGEDLKGQFFTPNELSKLMAQITFAECIESLKTQPFIKMSEPACGAGGMILPAVDMLIKAKYNPATTFFVQAVDVDRVSALCGALQQPGHLTQRERVEDENRPPSAALGPPRCYRVGGSRDHVLVRLPEVPARCSEEEISCSELGIALGHL